jgi:hypothetical protein
MAKLPGSDPASPRSSSFTPEVRDKTVIAIPLLKILESERWHCRSRAVGMSRGNETR